MPYNYSFLRLFFPPSSVLFLSFFFPFDYFSFIFFLLFVLFLSFLSHDYFSLHFVFPPSLCIVFQCFLFFPFIVSFVLLFVLFLSVFFPLTFILSVASVIRRISNAIFPSFISFSFTTLLFFLPFPRLTRLFNKCSSSSISFWFNIRFTFHFHKTKSLCWLFFSLQFPAPRQRHTKRFFNVLFYVLFYVLSFLLCSNGHSKERMAVSRVCGEWGGPWKGSSTLQHSLSWPR